MIKSTIDNRDRWEERSTVAIALKLLAPLYTEAHVKQLFEFLVETCDKDELVAQEQDAGVEAIKLHGASNVEVLIPIFENSLAKTSKESVVVLYGTLARDLDKNDPRLKIIIDRLMKVWTLPCNMPFLNVLLLWLLLWTICHKCLTSCLRNCLLLKSVIASRCSIWYRWVG